MRTRVAGDTHPVNTVTNRTSYIIKYKTVLYNIEYNGVLLYYIYIYIRTVMCVRYSYDYFCCDDDNATLPDDDDNGSVAVQVVVIRSEDVGTVADAAAAAVVVFGGRRPADDVSSRQAPACPGRIGTLCTTAQ